MHLTRHGIDPIIQLTSVSALQNSLDVLRKHRPDYTPRTGFVWPIMDPSVIEAHKRESEASADAETDSAVPQEKRAGIPKRQQNNMLLMHAMNTTAAHSKMSFTTSAAQNIENAGPETPITTTIRSSATPAPVPQETGLKVAAPQEATKGPTAGGKKKKKSLFPFQMVF